MFKGHIRITSNDNMKNARKINRMNKTTKINLIHIKLTLQYMTLTHYYIVKGHIQMTSNNSTISVETKNNRVNKMKNLHSIHIELH